MNIPPVPLCDNEHAAHEEPGIAGHTEIRVTCGEDVLSRGWFQNVDPEFAQMWVSFVLTEHTNRLQAAEIQRLVAALAPAEPTAMDPMLEMLFSLLQGDELDLEQQARLVRVLQGMAICDDVEVFDQGTPTRCILPRHDYNPHVGISRNKIVRWDR